MITEEQQGRMEPEMNSDQEVLKEQGLGDDEPQAQDHEPTGSLPPPQTPALDDERAVSTSGADEKEEGEISGEESGSTLENVPELHKQHTVEDEQGEVVVVVSPMKEEFTEGPPHSPNVVPLQVDDAAEGILNLDNSLVSPVGRPNSPPAKEEVVSPTVTSPGKKRSKGGRLWKKNGGKKKADKGAGELPSPRALHNSRDAGTQTDEQELRRNGLEVGPAAQHAAEGVVDQDRVAVEAKEPGLKSTMRKEQVHGESIQHESESTSAGPEREEGEIVEDPKVQPPFSSLKAFRSFGRWADVSEDVDTRAITDTDPDRITNPQISVDNQSSDSQQPDQALRAIPEQGFEGPHGQDIRTELKLNPNENGLRGKSQLGVAISPREEIRSPKGSPRGKGQQFFESSSRSLRSPRSRHDLRADSWSNHKEQDLRGKTQLGSRDSLSQASREPNWRRGPEEPRARQDMPRRSSKLGLDGDTKKDEQQDFRSRSQYGAEPQATHKNWIPRRGLGGHRVDGEGRAEQSKARGKGKQGGLDSEPQSQYTNDSAARQKFEADLRIKKDELLQRSKLSLKAEFQKAKRIEQARKGGDQLEMELNKNLVYEDGELFYLNT